MKYTAQTLIGIVLLISTIGYTQTPEGLNYQAIARNSAGEALGNTALGMKISILTGSDDGTAVYSETHQVTTNSFGLFKLVIGEGSSSDDFSGIDWGASDHFVKVEMDVNGGTNYSDFGTSQLLSVPYALYAKKAEMFTGTLVETDPIFSTSIAAAITSQDTSKWNNPALANEVDPVFDASVAAGITGTDTTSWNSKLSAENDPVFGASIAVGITGSDTTNWNNKLDSYTEMDPLFSSSIASGITGSDTANWNNSGGSLWTENGSNIYYNAGKVGIGTNSPVAMLDITTNSGDPFLNFQSNDNVYTLWYSSRSNVDDYLIGIDGGNNKFTFANLTTGYYPIVVHGQNVGFGTLNPDAKLDINIPGNGLQNILNISNISGGTADIAAFQYDGDNAPYPLILNMNAQGDYSRPFVISGGNVGIGIANPSEKLDVNGNVHVAGDLIVDGTIGGSDNVELKSNLSANLTGSGMRTNSTIDVNATGFGAALYIASDGNYEEADADAISTMPCVALALASGTGQKDILLQGYIRNDSWSWTVGGTIYVSPTTGELTQTIPTGTGQQVQIIGYATASNTIYFNPNLMLIELK